MTSENGNTVTGLLAADHRRLEEIWESAGRTLEAGNSADARESFAAFNQGLRRHIAIEEELLFPTIEQVGGLRRDFGPTAVMTAEHQSIRALLARLETLLQDDGDPRVRSRTMIELFALLESHDAKEEMVLYPMADRLIVDEDRDSLLRRIRAAFSV